MFLIIFFFLPYKYIFDTHIQNHYNNRSNKISFIYEKRIIIIMYWYRGCNTILWYNSGWTCEIFCLIFQMKFISKKGISLALFTVYIFLYRVHAFL